ncbi:MAG: hypothetical protein JRD69_09835 [Deltaproteobacteria bacterium]|nr:hypothetical protein [Deltaproteobacteria bacterium]
MSTDFIMSGEDAAANIQDNSIQLGADILLFFKMCAYNQAVLDRLALTDNNLLNEIEEDQGHLITGQPESIRENMHKWVDLFVDLAIKARDEYRSKPTTIEPAPASSEESEHGQ